MAKKKSKKSAPQALADQQDIVPLEEGWKKIHEGGVKPFFKRIDGFDQETFENKSIPQEEYSNTYDTIFNMCIQRDPYNFSEPLYLKHSEALVSHLRENDIPRLEKAKDQSNPISLLKIWNRCWQCGKWKVDGMKRMFMYLDRFHVPNSDDLLPMAERGYSLWKQNVFDEFKVAVRDSVLDCIRREREKEEQDRDMLRDAILTFVELGHQLTKVGIDLYKEDFQKKFIEETRSYYQSKSRSWMETDSCPDYIKKAEEAVQQEESRLENILHNSTREELMTAVRDELLKKHQKDLLNKATGINSLLEKESRADLARLYRLYEAVPDGLQPVADAMKVHVANLGNQFISKSKESKQGEEEHALIRNLISLHSRFLKIVQENFQNAQVFQKALKESFEEFINKEYYVSYLLAKFVNDMLRKSSKLDVGDFEGTLDHVVMLYGYIRDKDIFERDYQLHLANRLLQGTSKSEQSERAMIGKLKTECGYQWTSKLESMFKDVQQSQELMVSFNSQYRQKFDVELHVSVCTMGCWPASGTHQCIMPDQLGAITETFKSFYLTKHSGRRLLWRFDQGKADVFVRFSADVKKVLSVTTYQMMLLLLFNRQKTLTYQQVLDQTGIPSDDFQAHILSMAHPKVKVLLKNPNNNKVENNHSFTLNSRYKNKLYKIKIPLLKNLAKSADKAKKDMEEEQKTRRRHMIDAAIVRIMKTRKQLNHQQLLAEVIGQLKARFQPSGVDIKKRIESLIDQEFLERDDNDRTLYNYKA